MSRSRVDRAERLVLTPDTGVGNAKVLTVPTGRCWSVQSILLTLTTTATVGNRLVRIDVKNAAGTLVVFTGHTTAVPASVTAKKFAFFLGGPSTPQILTALDTVDPAYMSLPYLTLPAGYTMTIYDFANIAVLDTWAVQCLAVESNAPSGLSQ